MPRILAIILISFALAGCGVFGGGASYMAQLTDKDGRQFIVRADSATAAEEVTFSFIGNPLTGEIQGLKFSKKGVIPGEAAYGTINALIQKIPAAVP